MTENSEKNRAPISEETRRKLSDARKGKIHSAETRKKMAKARKNRTKKTCPVCNKTMNIGNYKQYNHGEACKKAPVAV